MTTPQSEIVELLERVQAREQDHDQGLIESLAFGVAARIVDYQDPGLLDKLPEWIKQQVHGMRDRYVRHGSFGYASNLGSVDHSEMMRKLTELLGKN
jgi:hypothetical protein